MSLLVTGSIGIDSVSTPAGNVENVLGGSAVYFAFAAVQFAPVRLVGVVGDRFGLEGVHQPYQRGDTGESPRRKILESTGPRSFE